MNQGLYHPSFNANGAAKASDDKYWHDTTQTFTSQADCFNPAKLLAGSGSIASGKSGRPSGGNLYYDAIYSSGTGGVCRDMRYSAYGVDSVDFAEADQRVKNGTYRGFERLVFSRAGVSDSAAYAGAWNSFNHRGVKANVGDTVIVEVSPNTFERKSVEVYTATQIMFLPAVSTNRPSNLRFVVESILSQSVGGSFLQTDVIGNPANILATPQLANGWHGSWVPVIPDGTSKAFPRTRKALSVIVRVYTTNNGSSWATSAQAAVADSNLIANGTIAANEVDIVQYLAFAKQTENAVNARVYGGDEGVGEVAFVRIHAPSMGGLLQESTIGKINTDSTARITSSKVFSLCISGETGVIEKYHAYAPKHFEQMFALVSPNNNSSSVKLLSYNVNLNQQAFIQCAYTELKHNGTNWGDDGKVTIVDNQSTKTDLNGNTVLVGTAKLKEPIGWIKIKV